jgi:uncharacterized protein
MKLKNKSAIFLVLTFLCLLALPSPAEVTIPDRPRNHVVDLAGIIDDSVEAGLNRYLLELEQKTTAQMVILTINSLEGESIEDLSIRIAHDKWQLGQKDQDNGLLMLIALKDRKYRIETGYGIEGIIPDSLAGSIGRQYLVPHFKQNDYSTGITKAALAMIQIIAADAGVEISGMPKLSRPSPYQGTGRGKPPTLLGKILSVLFFIGLIYLFIRHPRLLLLFLMMNMLGGGRRSGWGGGGGFGGGSFGGGGFGGGGAGGGW